MTLRKNIAAASLSLGLALGIATSAAAIDEMKDGMSKDEMKH